MQEETTDELAFLRISNLICILIKWRLDHSNLYPTRVALVAQMAKNPPAMQETWVQPLGWEDPLERGMAIHSSIFDWKIPRTKEPGGLQSMGSQRVGHN